MTREEINLLFPPSYGGNAQISDLRLALTHLVSEGALGLEFFSVPDIATRDNLDPDPGDICRVLDFNGEPATFIFTNDGWQLLLVGDGNVSSVYPKWTDLFLINMTSEMNRTVNLTEDIVNHEHVFVFLNGLLCKEEEYSINFEDNKIIFEGDTILKGDEVQVKYSYTE